MRTSMRILAALVFVGAVAGCASDDPANRRPVSAISDDHRVEQINSPSGPRTGN